MKKPNVATVTLTWNAERDIEDALNCVKKQTYTPKEIIVVDNGSTDRTVEIIKKKFSFVRLIRLDKNYGICKGYNIAFSKVSKDIDYVVVVDQDVLFDKDYIKKVVARFEKEPKDTAILMCDLEEPVIKTFALKEGYLKSFHGACYSYRNIYRHLMKFPEEFFGYGNEADLAARLINKKLKILFCPDFKVYHKKTLSIGTSNQIYYMTRNAFWYAWRNCSLKDSLVYTMAFIPIFYSKASRSGKVFVFLRGLAGAFCGIPYCIRTREVCNNITYRDINDLKKVGKIMKIITFGKSDFSGT